ncbi:hypothetical protein [Actinocorallia longicatena]|uniref:Uncharacterized protein n=1 Tax=Actinocorallia longicatena TaxID=111803 RepID=A0ABP6QJM8_9ACTN
MSELARLVRPARVARVARVVRLDARGGALIAAVALLAADGAVAAWRGLEPGVADWDGAVAAVEGSVRWLGPLGAGLAAWTGLRAQRLDYLRALAARSPAVAVLHDLSVLVAVCVLGYAAGALVACVRAFSVGGFGWIHPVGLTAGAATLALFVIVGYLSGRLWAHPATVAAVVAGSAVWASGRPRWGWAGLLPPVELGRVDLFEGLKGEVLAGQMFWAFGAGGVLVLGYVAAVTRRRGPAAAAAVALLVTAVCTLRLEAAGGVVTAPSAREYSCRDWPVTVCVHPALKGALPVLGAAVAPLATRLAGTPAAFGRVEQRSAREPAGVSGGTAAFHLTGLKDGFARRAVREIEAGLWRCPEPGLAGPGSYQAQVSAWLRDEPVPAAPAVPFTRWDEQRRRAWFTAHYPAYRVCGLGPASYAG